MEGKKKLHCIYESDIMKKDIEYFQLVVYWLMDYRISINQPHSHYIPMECNAVTLDEKGKFLQAAKTNENVLLSNSILFAARQS